MPLCLQSDTARASQAQEVWKDAWLMPITAVPEPHMFWSSSVLLFSVSKVGNVASVQGLGRMMAYWVCLRKDTSSSLSFATD